MFIHRQLIISLVAASASLTCLASFAEEDHVQEDPSKPDSELMRTMAHTDTFGHPDQYGQLSGMQDYTAGHYTAAMRQFLSGARYADKLSQLSIGLMYLQGQGVAKDPVLALAWISLGAERQYPKFVAARDVVARQLSPAQLQQARQLQAKLAASYGYGDAVAKRRLVRAMHEAMQYVNPVGRPPEGAYLYRGAPGQAG